jgi:hypothetical protein
MNGAQPHSPHADPQIDRATCLPAYQNQASIWQQSGQTWTMNGNGQFLINPGDNRGQVNDTINQFLKDPANGYGVTPQNPGAPWLTFTKDKQ